MATSQPANLPTISATLNGQRIVETNSIAVFSPICGFTTTEQDTEYALSLNNSTLTESNTGGLESHYYATLDHSQTDHTSTDCDGDSSYTRYSSTANYTHSSSNGSEVVDAAKTGDVVSDSDVFNELRDASIASLEATILAPDSTLITMMIDASDSLGSSLEVNIDNGQDQIEFTEDLNFRELSAQ